MTHIRLFKAPKALPQTGRPFSLPIWLYLAENSVVRARHLDAGMHVMTKPFAMKALATRIRALIQS